MSHNIAGRSGVTIDPETTTGASQTTGVTVAAHTVARRVAFLYNGVGGASLVHANFLGDNASNNFPGPFTNWWSTSSDVAVRVCATFELGWTGGSITIHGTLWDGTTDSEVLAANPGGLTNGTKWFKTITAAEKGAVGAAKTVSLDLDGGPNIIAVGAIFDVAISEASGMGPVLANVPGIGVSIDFDAAGLGAGDAITSSFNFSVPHPVTDAGHTHVHPAHTHTVMDPGHINSVPAFNMRSVKFDGVNGYISAGNVLNYDRTDAFSVEVLIKTTAKNGAIIAKMSAAPKGWAVVLDGGVMKFMMVNTLASNALIVSLNDDVTDGQWHQVLWSHTGSGTAAGVTCFHNGVAAGGLTTVQNNLSASITTSEPLLLGAKASGASDFYRGYMDEVAIYSAAKDLTAAGLIYNNRVPQDLTAAGMPGDLVAYWRCGDGATYPTIPELAIKYSNPYPTVIDSVGARNGTLTNMESGDFKADNPGGVATGSFEFDGVDEYATFGNTMAFDRTTTFTLLAWIKSTDSSGAIMSKWRTTSPSGYLWTTGTNQMSFGMVSTWTSNGFYVSCTATGISDGGWHLAAITYSGSGNAAGSEFYLDGNLLVKGAPAFNNLVSSVVHADPFLMAKDYSGASVPLAGKLSQAAYYNRVLSLAEIQWVYGGGVPQDLQGAGAPSGLQSWWKMGGTLVTPYNGTMINMAATDIQGDVP